LIVLLFAAPAAAQTPVEVVSVISRAADRQVRLPGEFLPYLSVAIHAKVTGFVDKVEVDRGSVVKRGQLLATLVAPEMKAQLAEAESKAQAIELQKAEAGARLAAAESTLCHRPASWSFGEKFPLSPFGQLRERLDNYLKSR